MTAAPPPPLLGPAQIRQLAQRLGIRPTKSWGQNFVVDANTVRRIVRRAGLASGDPVIEVGPGLGSLTLALLETGAHVTAVEIDRREARITVRYRADISAVTRDADGKMIAGSMSDASQTDDFWTFRRQLGSSDPNWLLDEVEAA